MSLSQAISQVSIGSTLDTWWQSGHVARTYYGKKERDTLNKSRRLSVLKCLIDAGRAMTINEIIQQTGELKQSVWNFIARLEDDDLVTVDRSAHPTLVNAVTKTKGGDA